MIYPCAALAVLFWLLPWQAAAGLFAALFTLGLAFLFSTLHLKDSFRG